MVSVIRCAAIWTNAKCTLLKWTGSLIAMTWLLPIISITYFLHGSWGSEEHIRTGYICWFFCGVREMGAHHKVYAGVVIKYMPPVMPRYIGGVVLGYTH
jgi:hypothetical protein